MAAQCFLLLLYYLSSSLLQVCKQQRLSAAAGPAQRHTRTKLRAPLDVHHFSCFKEEITGVAPNQTVLLWCIYGAIQWSRPSRSAHALRMRTENAFKHVHTPRRPLPRLLPGRQHRPPPPPLKA